MTARGQGWRFLRRMRKSRRLGRRGRDHRRCAAQTTAGTEGQAAPPCCEPRHHVHFHTHYRVRVYTLLAPAPAVHTSHLPNVNSLASLRLTMSCHHLHGRRSRYPRALSAISTRRPVLQTPAPGARSKYDRCSSMRSGRVSAMRRPRPVRTVSLPLLNPPPLATATLAPLPRLLLPLPLHPIPDYRTQVGISIWTLMSLWTSGTDPQMQMEIRAI